MKNYLKHIFFLGLLACNTVNIHAQDAPLSSLTLQIISQGTNIAITFAEIEILEANLSATSDSYGHATLSDLPEGSYLISIRHPNFEAQTISLNIPAGTNVRKTVTLIPQLEEVVITGKRTDQFLEDQGFTHRMKIGSGTYITRKEVKEKGRLNMTDVLRGIPGVNIQRYDSRLIATVNRARGKNSTSPCALDIFIDGYNVGGSPPDLNLVSTPSEVAAVEVYKGPSTLPARFSRFNSCGAIVIWTKMTIKDDE